jgi:hypothetical protein
MLTSVALVRKGFFPRELPPPFTSGNLADLYEADARSLRLAGKPTECVRHNLARLGGFRRPLKVPNPRSYLTLTKVLEKHWTLIDAHLKSEKIAISRPVVTRTRERAVRPRFRLGEGPKLRARLWRGQRFILRGDVSQFYPSLYTHAIPWALHTKPVAKANRGSTDGDEIDKAVRNCSSGQTIGIPIGPDTSFVVAEIVLAAVDGILRKKISGFRGFRYLDDYEAAFQTRAEAEEAQGHLESALGDFELVVNPFKTHILELPQPFKATWTRELAAFPIRTGSSSQTLNDTIALFSHAAELARRHPGALAYALRKSNEIRLDARSWRTFQGLVWSSVSVEPTTTAVALDLLNVKASEVGLPVAKRGATEVIVAQILRNAPLRNASEVAWALWAALELDVRLPASVARAVSAMEDDFVALLALDAEARGVFRAGVLDKSAWEALVDYDDVLLGDHWLLAYEGTLHGWVASAATRVRSDPFFSVLQRGGVHFYDPHPARAPFTGPAGPLPGAPIPDSYL